MIRIVYEDKDIVVLIKPVGISSEEVHMQPEFLKQGKELFTIHRLDQSVGGIMLFAKNKKAAAVLSAAVSEHRMKKRYMAVIHGRLEEKSGDMEDYLFKDSKKNKSYVVKKQRKGVKWAKLSYNVMGEVTKEEKEYSLVLIELFTGRTHQIRVQFSSRKHPLVGDGKYGSKENHALALWSYQIEFEHPTTKAKMIWEELPPNQYPWRNQLWKNG